MPTKNVPIMVTPEMVELFIVSEEYANMGERTTVCLLKLKNGIECVGSAVHQEAVTNDPVLGKKFAKEEAFYKAYTAVISHYTAKQMKD